MDTEAFVEMLPTRIGYNLLHIDSVRQHYTGANCPCRPERIVHIDPIVGASPTRTFFEESR